MSRPSRTPSVALGLLAGLAACGEPAPQVTWISLAEGLSPPPLEDGQQWATTAGGHPITLELEPGNSSPWLSARLGSDEWKPAPKEGLWWTTRPVRGFGKDSEGRYQELLVDGKPVTFREKHGIDSTEATDEDLYATAGDRLFLYTADGRRPGDALFRTFADRGQLQGPAWRVHLDRFAACDGLPVWPGQALEVDTPIPASSALRFATAANGMPASFGGASLVFRIELDGEPLFEHTLRLAKHAQAEWHTVDLTGEARDSTRLSFSVEGPAVLSAFLAPTLGPGEVGSLAHRPWGAKRPNIVLFVADTFRADLMEVYGGDPAITPTLNALARRSLTFEQAWSPSTWTLPSHASLFTGLFPEQHTVTHADNLLPLELVTLAEVLRDAGYRTCAKTDRGWVTESRNLDQGFETFVEGAKDLDEMLSVTRDLLEADDGRPLFLFLHTYQTHIPYRVSPQTRSEFGDRIEFGDYATLAAEWFEDSAEWNVGGELSAERNRALELYRNLYLGTAIDLDKSLAALFTLFEQHGVLDDGVFLFTSDHGEAFYEHETIAHGYGLWEENIRIPLVIAGGSVTPGLSPRAATLVDVPRTLAQAAGVASPSTWLGRSLFELDEDRPIFAFECSPRRDPDLMAIYRQGKKLILPALEPALRGGELELAYDLTVDGSETEDRSGEAWAERLLDELSDPTSLLLAPRVNSASQNLSADDEAQLRALGY